MEAAALVVAAVGVVLGFWVNGGLRLMSGRERARERLARDVWVRDALAPGPARERASARLDQDARALAAMPAGLGEPATLGVLVLAWAVCAGVPVWALGTQGGIGAMMRARLADQWYSPALRALFATDVRMVLTLGVWVVTCVCAGGAIGSWWTRALVRRGAVRREVARALSEARSARGEGGSGEARPLAGGAR